MRIVYLFIIICILSNSGNNVPKENTVPVNQLVIVANNPDRLSARIFMVIFGTSRTVFMEVSGR